MAGSEQAGMEPPTINLKLPTKQKADVFDQPHFDKVKFVNQIYPDENCLTDLDRFMAVLRQKIGALDGEIYRAVQAQGGAHVRAKQELAVAHAQIAELFVKVQGIQQKSGESEEVVKEICRDIKKLDFAKNHLTASITALRRLAMLTAAVSDLEAASKRRDQFKKCANLLEAVHQLMEYFQQYDDIPKVKNMSRRVQLVELHLKEAVLDDFRVLMGQADVRLSPEHLDRLAAACLVVNALGPKVRDQLMDWLCDREMGIYQAIFSASGDAAKLERFERRYLWFKSRLEDKRDQWSIFPDQWRVPQTLCVTFCKITAAQLKRMLSDDEAELRNDIGPLIKTVVATSKFEKEMAAFMMENGVGGDNISANEARKRLEVIRNKARQDGMKTKADKRLGVVRNKSRLDGMNNKADKMTDRERAMQQEAKTTFEGLISSAFEPSLVFYVEEEEKELLTHLEDRMISRGQTMLAITNVFKSIGQASAPPPSCASALYSTLSQDHERS
eukprot:gene6224-2841_t